MTRNLQAPARVDIAPESARPHRRQPLGEGARRLVGGGDDELARQVDVAPPSAALHGGQPLREGPGVLEGLSLQGGPAVRVDETYAASLPPQP